MQDADPQPDEQTNLWNGSAGAAWVDEQQLLDRMFKPFEELLVQAAVAASATQVLDVGCGTGSTTLAVARALHGRGECVGIDLSQPMIAAAQRRAEAERARVSFVRGNAQTYTLAAASYDFVISRFGVMFFEDPTQAFTNVRRAARDGAELRCIAWRSPEDNPFMTAAERAAAPFLPSLPVRRADAPGQFGFADPRRVQQILTDSGWSSIAIRPLDVECTLPEAELDRYLTRLGPLGVILPQVDVQTQALVIGEVRKAFEPYVAGAEVRFTAACWDVTARADESWAQHA